MVFDNLLFECDGPVASVTINRPAVLNALDTHTFDELRQVFRHVRQDAGIQIGRAHV